MSEIMYSKCMLLNDIIIIEVCFYVKKSVNILIFVIFPLQNALT